MRRLQRRVKVIILSLYLSLVLSFKGFIRIYIYSYTGIHTNIERFNVYVQVMKYRYLITLRNLNATSPYFMQIHDR